MSEMPAAGSESPAPTSTADVASNVIDAFDQTTSADPGSDPGDDAPEAPEAPVTAAPEPTATPAPKAAPDPVALTEEEQLLKEFGFKDAKKPDGRDHYIPRPKVLQMLASGLKRGKEKWTAERGVIESQASEYRGALDELRNDVLSADPRELLGKLADVNPAYRQVLDRLDGPAPQAAQAVPADKPKPDVDLGNGQWTYSVEGVEKLAEWKAQQLIEARFKPLEERDKAAQQQAARQQAEREQGQRLQAQMQAAQAWPGFGTIGAELTDFQSAVLAKLQQDSQQAAARRERPTMSLREAYLEVYAEQLSTDRNAVRADVLKGLKTAPAAPALSRQPVDSPRAPGPVSTADVASKVIDRLTRGA